MRFFRGGEDKATEPGDRELASAAASPLELGALPEAPPPGPQLLMDGLLFAEWFIRYELHKELQRAHRNERPISILIFSPSPSLGQRLTPAALELAATTAMNCARATDLIGWLSNDRILVIMPETDRDGASAAGYRWRTEMYSRTMSVGALRWLVSTCENPFEYESAEELVNAVTRAAA